jgi:glycosyltransferase involved in cell wall biosynthesis
MSSPAVSVLTAVRNGRTTFADAFFSIQSQSFTDWEWLVVDDGSTDGTAALLADLARSEPRLRVISTPPAGLVPALNRGLDAVRAPIVARMDADDVAHPERIAAQVALLAAHPEVAACDTQVELLGGERNAGMRAYVDWVNAHPGPAAIAADLFVESPLVHPAVCFRTATVRASGGYRAGDFPEDYDLWLRLHRAGFALDKVPRILFSWRDTQDRLSRTDRRYRRAAFTRLKQEHLLALDGEAIRGAGFALWGAGRLARPWRQWLRAIGATPRFVADIHPRRIGHTMLDAPVISAAAVPGQAWRYLLVTVSGNEARAATRALLSAWGIDGDPDRRVRFV